MITDDPDIVPRIGYGLALFAAAGPDVPRLVAEHEGYVSRWGGSLRWWTDDDDESWRIATPELLAYPRRRLLAGRRRKDTGFSAYAHGGESAESTAPNFLAICTPDPTYRELSGVLQLWPLDAFDAKLLLEECVLASRRLQPRQGYGGLMLAPIVDLETGQRAHQLQFAISQQLEGVEIPNNWFTAQAKPDSLCAVQWLTIVCDELLAPLGGRAVLADLPSGVVVHDYGSGVVIQAGDAPSAGDVNKGETIPLYRAVAKKLAPIRIKNPLPLNVERPNSLDRAETGKWFKRLERDS